MRFHKLEMVGFKSFVDKTTLTFQPGMTAVVGPNGCGKSNISDAIRWVLGEKSAKYLRGEKMEDVIFNGTSLRKPLGMAEVNLTLQDVAGSNTLGFTEFKEITITRRLYRSGDSEYLINKIPCRLKDIRDLLMDTGVGSRAYSIIEQGKIGQLLASKPEERRYIIEEVAGITKYKARKNEALAKLAETDDNLSRVSDILHEVKRQMNSVDRQAKKAERYKKLTGELRGIELKMAWDDFGALLSTASLAEADHKRLSEEESAARNSVSAREADLSEARLKLAERERELMEFQKEIHRLESEVSRIEAKAEVAASQLMDLDNRVERIESQKGDLAKEAAELDRQASTLKEEQKVLKEELDGLTEALKAIESVYQEKANRVHGLETNIEEERGRLFEAQAAISQKTNKLARLDERLAELETKMKRAAEEETATRAHLMELKLAQEKKRLEQGSVTAEMEAIERQRSSALVKQDEAKELIKSLEAELARGRDLYSHKSSRLKSLKELEEGLEGYGEGVKAVMAEKKSGRVRGIHGLVADLLQVRPEHERAVESALGERLQNLVVDGHNDAKAALEYLKESGLGRGSFMPVSPRGATGGDKSPAAVGGAVGYASKLVSAKAGYEAVVEALLGRVLIVSDLEAALTIWGEVSDSTTIVTLDGELLEPHGALTGGSEGKGGGILSKKREIRELTSETERLARENEALDISLTDAKGDLGAVEATLKTLQETHNERRILLAGLEKDLAVTNAELERVEKKLEVIGIESAQHSQEQNDINDGMAHTRTELLEEEEKKRVKEEAISGLQEELKTVRAEIEADREALTAKKMELSALIQKHESSIRDIKRADMQREELTRKDGRIKDEEQEIAGRRSELTAVRLEAEGAVNGLMRSVIEKKDGLPAVQDGYQTATDAITALDEAVKETRHRADDCGKALSETELRRAELRLKLEHLRETVDRNYHVQLEDIDDTIKQAESARDEAEMNASEIRIKLERLGPVNVGAIDEYNELLERFNFLNSQKEDLESSVSSLKEAIGKINKTSEELFMDAFNSINETFKTVFVSLFGGGQAELRLATPEDGDVLESGLDIVAQPPGKKLQSLTLFSGGEKALIAAALVFACFLVKPSPFCVLDEVDAPLDEANVQRFGNMLKEFADRTQFIVITHSRPTMELADALYGVTMDEPGTSSLVSVKLKEAAQLAEV